MIIFFGPAGAGKSVQGQLLAARHGFKWLSTGQLLRNSESDVIQEKMKLGGLVGSEYVTELFSKALQTNQHAKQIIVDGFPRRLEQAHWLVESRNDYGRSIRQVIVLEVPKSELVRRLETRGRADDTPQAIEERLNIYRQEMYPILGYFNEHKIPIVHIDGTGSVGQVHDRIEAELEACSLV